jgi:4-hydroxy-3-methylbut-2-en-1-yl diphosphate synthase IspG/GcpE
MSATNAAAVYHTDNGAVLCGEHLGATAKSSGRDLSGQPIEEVTPDLLAEARATPDGAEWIRCERCGRRPSALHLATA